MMRMMKMMGVVVVVVYPFITIVVHAIAAEFFGLIAHHRSVVRLNPAATAITDLVLTHTHTALLLSRRCTEAIVCKAIAVVIKTIAGCLGGFIVRNRTVGRLNPSRATPADFHRARTHTVLLITSRGGQSIIHDAIAVVVHPVAHFGATRVGGGIVVIAVCPVR